MDDYQAFQPPASALEDAPVEGQLLAERGTRLGAVMLDGLIFASGLFLAGILAAILIPAMRDRRGPGVVLVPILVLVGAWCLALVVWNALWVHKYGQSIGKRILKIRVVRTSGERASLARIFFLRNLPLMILGVIPILGPLLTLLDELLIFRESAQCLHDQIADTKVILA